MLCWQKIRNTDVVVTNDRCVVTYDGKEERGKLNIFVASIWAPETSHNNKQQNQNGDSYIQTVSIADNWTLGN